MQFIVGPKAACGCAKPCELTSGVVSLSMPQQAKVAGHPHILVFQLLSCFLFPGTAEGSHLCATDDILTTGAPNSLLPAVPIQSQ